MLALGIEAALGYPGPVYRALGHPVTWIGALIGVLDRAFNRDTWSAARRRAAGVLALLVLAGVPVAVAVTLHLLLTGPWPGAGLAGWAALAVIAATLLAPRSLDDHIRAVAAGLERGGLAEGRVQVARIVGRDPATLDTAGVARAAIESLAENFSDGVVAPALWFALLGLPGLAGYKAVNTADSMIGHRTPRHAAFGWAAARTDDVINLPASRLTAALIVVAAALVPGADPAGAWRAVRRDARHHRSPNAGWPEAAMAGALGLRLAGPRVYGGVRVDDAFMGDGRAEAGAGDIRRALLIYRVAAGLLVALAAVPAALLLIAAPG